ncbi:hypothetical protein KP509_05G029500 [Ceratopteris richardii]|uniref:Uncharacterized protein n=1 Tax=Ceratopteris richardii TaxID=49495 RepID=A0A8T2UMJ3_CERRI|nr:hypothetical protein KP509_05G029500 [Ceratopteris richardii]
MVTNATTVSVVARSKGGGEGGDGVDTLIVVRKSDEQVEASVETLSRRRVDMDDEGQNINIYGTRSGAQEHGSEDRGLSLQQESYSENVVCEILTESTEQDLLALVDKRNEENMSSNSFIGVMAHHQYFGGKPLKRDALLSSLHHWICS